MLLFKKINDVTVELIKDLNEEDYFDGILDAVRDAMGIVKNLGHLSGPEKKAFVIEGFKSAINIAQDQGYLKFLGDSSKMMLFALSP